MMSKEEFLTKLQELKEEFAALLPQQAEDISIEESSGDVFVDLGLKPSNEA